MNKFIKRTLPILAGLSLLSACDDNAGKVSLGLFTTKDILIKAFHDPKLPGVICHVAHVEANLDFADPSNMSIACRQIGEITPEQVKTLDLDDAGEKIFTKSKSILFKSLKVRRIFDVENQTLVYLSYSTHETAGSHKHSLSTVPLYGSKAYGVVQKPKG
ncbi:CreA family protein [Algicola sagamiensis]|uniref:CreA family protein n=1 Tax=Algicola sagamiensis TaxID=163869 RepID=UPI00036D3DB6|nr:CreA family protein [Algicola sagamiensis]